MNTATSFHILDGRDYDPEALAMLQAFYSRSPMPIVERLARMGQETDKVRERLQTYYIGYGHESIGELGDTTIFIEGLSMAAAKAFQDCPLYRGQECSTRYMDCSRQPLYVPPNVERFRPLMQGWVDIYMEALPLVLDWAAETYSADFVLPNTDMSNEERDRLYSKTLKAIAFDVCRGLLPIGMHTSIAWTGDFRTIGRQLRRLMAHSLKEVREQARNLYSQLSTKYPNSFKRLRVSDETIQIDYYYTSGDAVGRTLAVNMDPFASSADWAALRHFLTRRESRHLELLPNRLAHLATIYSQDMLDFASYRDLQRHRPGYMGLSLPTPRVKIDQGWYWDRYPKIIQNKVQDHLAKVLPFLENAQSYELAPAEQQYFLPMMTRVPVYFQWSLGHSIYAFNLRSGVTVHPTLRERVKLWAESAALYFAFNPYTLDPREDYQATHRGRQDIVQMTVPPEHERKA